MSAQKGLGLAPPVDFPSTGLRWLGCPLVLIVEEPCSSARTSTEAPFQFARPLVHLLVVASLGTAPTTASPTYVLVVAPTVRVAILVDEVG